MEQTLVSIVSSIKTESEDENEAQNEVFELPVKLPIINYNKKIKRASIFAQEQQQNELVMNQPRISKKSNPSKK